MAEILITDRRVGPIRARVGEIALEILDGGEAG